jgi:hypothetical protein
MWSPDGNQLLINHATSSGPIIKFDSVLVDIDQKWAATIAEATIPLGWLVK